MHGKTVSLSEDPSNEYMVVGWASNSDPESLHVNFKENYRMKGMIRKVLLENYRTSKYLASLASTYGEGWMHIADGRAMSIFSRTPEPDDILGTILVRDGIIVDGSLQIMPTHRLLTVNGIFQLPTEFQSLLKNEK